MVIGWESNIFFFRNNEKISNVCDCGSGFTHKTQLKTLVSVRKKQYKLVKKTWRFNGASAIPDKLLSLCKQRSNMVHTRNKASERPSSARSLWLLALPWMWHRSTPKWHHLQSQTAASRLWFHGVPGLDEAIRPRQPAVPDLNDVMQRRWCTAKAIQQAKEHQLNAPTSAPWLLLMMTSCQLIRRLTGTCWCHCGRHWFPSPVWVEGARHCSRSTDTSSVPPNHCVAHATTCTCAASNRNPEYWN